MLTALSLFSQGAYLGSVFKKKKKTDQDFSNFWLTCFGICRKLKIKVNLYLYFLYVFHIYKSDFPVLVIIKALLDIARNSLLYVWFSIHILLVAAETKRKIGKDSGNQCWKKSHPDLLCRKFYSTVWACEQK